MQTSQCALEQSGILICEWTYCEFGFKIFFLLPATIFAGAWTLGQCNMQDLRMQKWTLKNRGDSVKNTGKIHVLFS